MSDLTDSTDSRVVTLLKQIELVEAQIEESKKLYEQRDQLTLALKEAGFTGPLEHEGKTYTLVNNFEATNVCYRAAFVRLWEVKIKAVKPPKQAKGTDQGELT